MASIGNLIVKKFGSEEILFQSEIARYSVQDNQLHVILEGTLKDITSLQKNTIYTLYIDTIEETMSITRDVIFLYYSYNCGSTGIIDENGNIPTTIAVLDNSIQFQLVL